MDSTEHLGEEHHEMVFSFERDREKKLYAYFFLLSGIIIFALTLLGFTNGISQWTTQFLIDHLGFTNKWSKTYGPEWFVDLMMETSALGGKVTILIGSLLVAIYYKLKRRNRLLWKFLFVLLGGNFILLILKLIYAEDIPYEPFDLLTRNITPFPSGHAMISLVFYLSLAVLLTRKQRRKKIRSFTLISALMIVSIISISRVFVGAHTVTEVLGGISIGLIWLCLCWLGEHYLKVHYRWDI